MSETITLGLATLYICWILIQEDGPFNILKDMRNLAGYNCIVCMSIWVALGMYLLDQWFPVVKIPIAVAGIATSIYFPVAYYHGCVLALRGDESGIHTDSGQINDSDDANDISRN